MSSGEPSRKVSRADIQLVQNLIERCLQLYMNQQEVVRTLLDQAKIEPDFTELVWQKLEDENREFFKAYHLRLMVKQQIDTFNELLKKQVQLMSQVCPGGLTSIPLSNGSNMSALHQNPMCYAPDHTGSSLQLDNMHASMPSGLHGTFTNGGSSLQANVHATVDMSAHARRMDATSHILPSGSSGMGLVEGNSGGMIKMEPGYAAGSPYMFGADGNVLEAHSAIPGAYVPSFNAVQSNTQSLNDSLLEQDQSPYGFLGQISRSISFSDISHFPQTSDILESYPRSPYLTEAGNNFLDNREQRDLQENRRLDTLSEALSYEDFGSE